MAGEREGHHEIGSPEAVVPANDINPWHPHPGIAGVGHSPQTTGNAVGVARCRQARFPGLSPISTRRTDQFKSLV
jgi:hypothetical protein